MVNNRLMEWRTKCKYSRQLIADCLGVSRDTIAKFEKGDISKLNLEHLFILCGKQIEINVGINPTYEKKGYNRTRTGYIIPMMDCELGYLLGEEGYENRTRAKTDICKATGLSEDTVGFLVRKKNDMDNDVISHADTELYALLDWFAVHGNDGYNNSEMLMYYVKQAHKCLTPYSNIELSEEYKEYMEDTERECFKDNVRPEVKVEGCTMFLNDIGHYVLGKHDAASFYLDKASECFAQLVRGFIYSECGEC